MQEGWIASSQIKIISRIKIQQLLRFSYDILPNEHAIATIIGRLEAEEQDWKKVLEREQEEVRIVFETEQGEETVFSGYLTQFHLEEQTGLPIVTMQVSSGTILLDRVKVKQSYQDISYSYAEIVEKAIRKTNMASCICTIGEDLFPEKPLFQYRESNWEFVRRLASQLKGVLYPDISTPFPRFYFGFPKEKETKELKGKGYQVGVSKRFYELGGTQAAYKPQDFIYYQVETSQNIALDTSILWKERRWRIGRKSVALRKEELYFTYLLCQPPLVSLKPYQNSLFSGMSLAGRVLATKGEMIKLHLEIDKTQEIETAYPYEWIPDTGSVMYCMPKVGSKVSLYFSSEEEASAKVVNCIRENGETCEGMSEPNQRGLTTEHGKKLFLHPKELGISEEEKGNFLTLKDDIGVRLESSKKIEITAKGNITLIGKQVQFETPIEINLASMNQINPSKSTKKEKMNTTTMPSLSPLTPFSSTGSTQVDFHLLSNTTQASSIDEDNLSEILLFMHWTSDPPRHPEKEYYVTSAGKDYAVMRSLMSAIPFGDKAYDWLSEWLMDVEIVTAKDMENAIKNFIGNVNNVYSILDSSGAIKKFVEWEKVPNVVKKGTKWATNASTIITLLFVAADTIKEIANDYNTAYIVDFIFGREMLADDKETALVKYVYAYQEIKKLVNEGKIKYEHGIFEKFKALSWNGEDINKIIENLEFIDSMK